MLNARSKLGVWKLAKKDLKCSLRVEGFNVANIPRLRLPKFNLFGRVEPRLSDVKTRIIRKGVSVFIVEENTSRKTLQFYLCISVTWRLLLRRNILNKERCKYCTLECILCFRLQGLGTKELINKFLFMFPVAPGQSYKPNFFGNVLLL